MLVAMNNALTGLFVKKQSPDRVCVLLPHCLQWHDCTCEVTKDLQQCKRCGRCRLKDIANLCQTYGVPAFVVAGGQLAIAKVKEKNPELVIAIACNKELILGLLTVFPRRVFAIHNAIPNGPCRDTTVDVDELSQAFDRFLLKG